MIVGIFSTLSAQIDTLGVYNLTDGGGDPTNKAARVKVQNLAFSDYARVGVTASSGSGFFVSKGFPFGGADYNDGLYHTFVVTPQNGSTLYIKKFSMNHKRSGSNPNPGNTVNFKCVVSFDDKEYVFGTGTTVNQTAWYYADNLKIITTGSVTFKLYAKDLFDASQSWMQRWVSLIGAVAPEGTDIEDITGPLDPTYLEVAHDYINSLTFYTLDALGELVAPLINDMSGLPLNYTFIMNNEADLTSVSFNFKLPAGTTLESAMPTNFSIVSKQSVVLKSSWGTRKANITVKKIKSTSADVDIKFDAINGTNSWNETTTGWIANNISGTVTSQVQFATEKASFIVSTANQMKQLAFDISMVEATTFAGMFTIETSADASTWNNVSFFNKCNPITSSVARIVADIPLDTKYVRFVYNCRNGSQTVNVNNIQMVRSDATKVITHSVDKLNIYPNPAHSQITLSNANSLKEFSIFSISGMLVKKILFPVAVVPVNDLQQGIYYVKSLTNTGSILVSELIIQ